MNKKVLIVIILIIILITILWITGIIPKQIGKIYGTKYMKNKIETYQEKYSQKANKEEFDIANKIETIISKVNQNSSNPYDYIKASKQEYNELLEHPKETFEYSIKDLIDTNASNGLVSYIEAILCSEINKNFQYNFSSANDYLEKYKEFLIKSDSILNDYDTYTKSLLN